MVAEAHRIVKRKKRRNQNETRNLEWRFDRIIEKYKKKDTLVTSDKDEIVPECYCVICYVDRFCNIHIFQNHDGSETHYIFKEKGSSGNILYQSSSIIERIVSSSSE